MNLNMMRAIAQGQKSPAHAVQAMRKLQKLAEKQQLGPLADAEKPTAKGQLGGGLEQAKGVFIGNYLLPPTRFIRVSNVTSVAAGGTSSALRVEFSQGAGWVIGFRATVLATTLTNDFITSGRQLIGVQINLNGNRDLMSNGVSSDFPILATLHGDVDDFCPLLIRVDVKDVINVTFKNFSGGTAFTPDLTFRFRDDADNRP